MGQVRRFQGILLCAFTCGISAAAQAPPPTLRIPRVNTPPSIEDFLNQTPREAEAVITELFQREPGDGIPASRPTTAYLSYDEKNLYVVFVCKDDPGEVRAHLAKREDFQNDDAVGVLLDTFHDRRRAYIFVSNPLGIQLDGITTEGRDDDYSFDTLWHTEGRRTSDGFIVWMAIPFKSLRFPNEPVQRWGVAVGRIYPRNNETSFWPFITRRVEGFVQQMAVLEGLEQISPGRNLQFIPYGIVSRSRFLDENAPTGPAFSTSTDGRGGLDAKIVFRDAFTLDVALNPDFSQVESDEPQVTVNQRFEVFFPEKRPFFIENAGFFQTPVNLFFSRRIADPQFGLRLTGKAGRWALAGLLADDRAPGRRVPPGDPLRGERAAIGVLRAQREFAEQSFFGVFISSRDFASSSSRVFSLDTRIKLNPNWVLEAQAIRSYTRPLGGSRVSGPAYRAELRRSSRNFTYVGRYVDRSPDFRAPLGFIPRVDIRQTEHFARWSIRPEKGPLLAYGPDVFTLVNWNRAGQVQDWFVNFDWGMEFVRGTRVELSRDEAFELFQNFGFRKHSTSYDFSTEWLSWLSFSAEYNHGTRANFFPGVGLQPFLAEFGDAEVGFTLRPAPRLRWDQTYIYSRLATRAGSTPAGFPPGASIFNNHLVRTKINYQFTRELSFRAILDYESLLPNPQLVDEEREKRFTADFLVTYLLHPGTAIYFGYTDIYDNLTLDPTMPPALRRIKSPTTSTGRQFFVKASYLFRF